uniref:F-box domain-containing protein n=1 Tax=Panagrellus redivivus TaxID=6233 RepID=A0A7E4ZZ39_PANRE
MHVHRFCTAVRRHLSLFYASCGPFAPTAFILQGSLRLCRKCLRGEYRRAVVDRASLSSTFSPLGALTTDREMSPTLLTLPEEVLALVCHELPAVADVINLQNTHRVLNYRINRAFWGMPKGLTFADDAGVTSLELVEGRKMVIKKPTKANMEFIVSKTRNLQTVFLNRSIESNDDAVRETLRLLRKSDKHRLQKIVVIYHKPELNLHRDKSAWPSREAHNELCKLVRTKAQTSLRFFGIGIAGTDDFVSISRRSLSDHKITMQYNHEPSWDSKFHVFLPLLNAFGSASRSTELSIEMRMTPSHAHILLDHCIQCCVPSHFGNTLEHISVNFTAVEGNSNGESVIFKNFNNTRHLKSLVWSFGPEFPEHMIERMCCPTEGHGYDIFVNTPYLKKTFVGAPIVNKFDSNPMLKFSSRIF